MTDKALPELPRAVAYVEVVPAKDGAGYDADVNIWANMPGQPHPEGTDGLYTAAQMHAFGKETLALNAESCFAWNGHMVRGDKASVQAVVDMVSGAGQWRPIETAPEDGSEFMTYIPGMEGSDAFDFARWDEESGFFWKDKCGFIYVTHWQPLPEPPK